MTAEICSEPGKAFPRRRAAERVDLVDLVQHELERDLVRTDLAEHGVNGVDHLLEPVVRLGGVDDVQHEVRDERLLQRRREALDELRRQLADEADGIGDEIALALVLEAPRRRVERLEEPVLDAHLRAR